MLLMGLLKQQLKYQKRMRNPGERKERNKKQQARQTLFKAQVQTQALLGTALKYCDLVNKEGSN